LANPSGVASLILNRIAYAVNWYNLATVFSLIASEFKQNVSGLGLASAAFYLGIGIFQLPAGILAARIGPRLTAVYGTIIYSVAAVLTGFAGSMVEIIVLRFLVGLGMAFVFAPGIILIVRSLRKGSEGLGVGLYNSAFNSGGVIGLLGWAVLASTVGWRNSLIVGGSIGLATSVLLLVALPKEHKHVDFKINFSDLKLILLDKWLITLSIALLGFGVGNAVLGGFMAYYLESATHLSVGLSGAIASLTLVFAFFVAPFSGRLLDRSGNSKRLIVAAGVLMSLGIGVAALSTVYSAVLAVALVGSAYGAGMTFVFSAARATNKSDQEYETLAVSWVNSISLFGNFIPPLLFSFLVLRFGYSPAWLCIAALTLLLMIPIALKGSKNKE